MSQRREEVLSRIRAGEDGRTEFKEIRLHERGIAAPRTEETAAELVALANADGGLLLLGVEDSGAVAGVPEERLREVQHWIADVATNNCEPAIRPTIRSESAPDAAGAERSVVVVEIPRGIFVHQTAGGRYYTRVGPTKRLLNPPELARLFQERGRGFVFDEQIVFEAGVEALQWSRLESFFGRSPPLPWLDLLRNTRVTARDRDGVDRPTVAGLLTFGKDPTDFLPSAFVEAAQYGGTALSSTELVREDRLDGRAADQIDAAVAFVAASMAPGPGSGRDAGPDEGAPYDLEVVEEGVVNAVAHRDYSIHGSKIRLFVYADRLEIYSPGRLPNDLTPGNLQYRTFSRNQLLVSFLSKLQSKRTDRVYIESRGEGVRTILRRGEAHSGRRPEYDLFGSELRLTIWARRS